MKIFCLIHRFYKGKTPPPTLACKACCQIFLSEIKRKHEKGEAIPVFDFESTYKKQSFKARQNPSLYTII